MAAPVALSSGAVFAQDYRIERPLAEGGMGSVYVVEQLSTGKRRALKVMHPTLVPDVKSRARFVDEARVSGRIDSDHVVEVLAAGVDDASGIPWLVMELLEGGDLDAYVRARGRLAPDETLELLEQAGHALAQAHALGIIHRDLKPENLFVSQSKRRRGGALVKILDFGIARMVEGNRTAATATSAIGSPLWMAPEQAQPGAKLRASTDVWALGLIAYFMLTGKAYWDAANHPQFNLSALLVEVMTHPIVPPSTRAGVALPAGFDAWFLRCVDRDPLARFADAAQAVSALAAALGQGAASPRRVTPATQPIGISGQSTAPLGTAALADAVTPPPHSFVDTQPSRGLGGGALAALAGVGLLAVIGMVVGVTVLAAPDDPIPMADRTPPAEQGEDALHAAPPPSAGTVRIATDAVDATLYVNSERRGPLTDPMTLSLPAGVYMLEARQDQTTLASTTVTVEAGAVMDVTLNVPVAELPDEVARTPADVTRVVSEHRPQVQRCYERHARGSGRVTLSLHATTSGEIASAECVDVSLGSAAACRCIEDAALEWNLGPGGAGRYTIPFSFTERRSTRRRAATTRRAAPAPAPRPAPRSRSGGGDPMPENPF